MQDFNAKIALVVEDSLNTRKLIDMALGSAGIKHVVEAENGETALVALKNGHADLVVMDWQMDVMDGLECTRRIRSGIEGIDPRLPIILLTGIGGKESEAAAYAAGVNFFMEKPFSIKALHAGIIKVMAPSEE